MMNDSDDNSTSSLCSRGRTYHYSALSWNDNNLCNDSHCVIAYSGGHTNNSFTVFLPHPRSKHLLELMADFDGSVHGAWDYQRRLAVQYD